VGPHEARELSRSTHRATGSSVDARISVTALPANALPTTTVEVRNVIKPSGLVAGVSIPQPSTTHEAANSILLTPLGGTLSQIVSREKGDPYRQSAQSRCNSNTLKPRYGPRVFSGVPLSKATADWQPSEGVNSNQRWRQPPWAVDHGCRNGRRVMRTKITALLGTATKLIRRILEANLPIAAASGIRTH